MEKGLNRVKTSPEDRIKAVEEYLSKQCTLRQLGEQYGVHHSTVEKWVNAYLTFGEEGLHPARHNRKYSEELKKEAVKLYLTTDHSLKEVCNRYKIRRMSVLQNWILKYRV